MRESGLGSATGRHESDAAHLLILRNRAGEFDLPSRVAQLRFPSSKVLRDPASSEVRAGVAVMRIMLVRLYRF